MGFATGTAWEVRMTGSDTNGGGYSSGGVDYSKQSTPQIAVADAVANGTNTITSATAGFVAGHQGNGIYLAGGSGSLAGTWRQIISVTNSTTVIVDSTVATGTGITLNLGGALASPGQTAALVVAGNTVFIKSGTYICSATPNVSGGRPQPAFGSRWIGYVASRGDAALWGTMPSLKAGAASMTVFTAGQQDICVENIELDGQSPTYASVNGFGTTSGGLRLRLVNCRAVNMTVSGFAADICQYHYCEAVNCGVAGFYVGQATSGSGVVQGCLARGNVAGFIFNGNNSFAVECVAYGNSSHGFQTFYASIACRCSSIGNGGDGFQFSVATSMADSCISYGNTGVGYNASAAQYDALLLNCAAGSNTGGQVSSNIPSANNIGYIPLTADPFVARTSLNFALNNAPGGGALLRGAALGAGPGAATTGYPDVGAVQHRDSGSVYIEG